MGPISPAETQPDPAPFAQSGYRLCRVFGETNSRFARFLTLQLDQIWGQAHILSLAIDSRTGLLGAVQRHK